MHKIINNRMDKDEFDFTTNESDFTFEEDPVEELNLFVLCIDLIKLIFIK